MLTSINQLTDLHCQILDIYEQLPNSARGSVLESYGLMIEDLSIREIFEWEIPVISDLSRILSAKDGKIEAIRLDLLSGNIGLKKPVIAGLIIRHLLHRLNRSSIIKGIIDGGNFNTGLALSHFGKKLGISSTLVHSRYFPAHLREFLSNLDNLKLAKAPPSDIGIEREFYNYLLKLVRYCPDYRNYLCLWHAKYGGSAIRPIGIELSNNMKSPPDYIVLSLGSGANLEGIAIPICEYYNYKPQIIIIEHELSPLFNTTIFDRLDFNFTKDKSFSYDWIPNPPKGIPHLVVGPHYDEINPLLSRKTLSRVKYVVRYTDSDWKWMASYCKQANLSIGNSSAANLLVARAIAERGYSVMTFIYEPRRFFYERNLIY